MPCAHRRLFGSQMAEMRVFGSEGAVFYGGFDNDPESGRLELRLRATGGKVEVLHDKFHFENCDDEGLGPESVIKFVDGCRGLGVFRGADAALGLATVSVIDAMYRSNAAGGAPITVRTAP